MNDTQLLDKIDAEIALLNATLSEAMMEADINVKEACGLNIMIRELKYFRTVVVQTQKKVKKN